MPDLPQDDIFSAQLNLELYKVEDLPPAPVDKRGYIYLVLDSVYPEYVKIGKSRNMHSRLNAYNRDRPTRTVYASYVSVLFQDSSLVEKRILREMYKTCTTGSLTKEWFEIKHYDILKDYIQRAEEYFKDIFV